MSTDEDYASFLDKANQDTGASKQLKADTKFAATKAVNASVPAPLHKLNDEFYISDTDEPFEPVALGHSGKELDERSFAKLIDHSGDVEATDLASWNKSEQYDNVVRAVEACGDGSRGIKIFRVGHGGTRCEYYVVVLSKEGNVVGVRAKAVES